MLFAERASWAIGLAGVIWLGAYQIEVATSARQNLERFAALRPPPLAEPDQSLWSAIRISAWHDAMREPAAAPLAVLRIPKIRLEVAVLPGTDDRTLDRAVGHIEDTAPPGTDGNSVIAGHRDGFFRGLKDIAPGDAIVLETLRRDRDLSGRAHVDRRARGRVGVGSDALPVADPGHLLSVLLRRFRPAAIHRPRRPCRERRRPRPVPVNHRFARNLILEDAISESRNGNGECYVT